MCMQDLGELHMPMLHMCCWPCQCGIGPYQSSHPCHQMVHLYHSMLTFNPSNQEMPQYIDQIHSHTIQIIYAAHTIDTMHAFHAYAYTHT